MHKISLILALFAALAAAPVSAPQNAQPPSAAESMAAKLDHLRQNGEQAQPDQTPTTLSEDEINAYFAAQMVGLPKGVRAVTFSGEAGVVTATTSINFEEVKEGRTSANPLLAIFTGTHDVKVIGEVSGAGGRGTVHIRDAAIDGISVPRLVLEIFVERFLKPKYPNVGLDTTFALSARVDTAVVGKHVLTVTQK